MTLFLLLAASSLSAQDYRRHNFTFGAGAMRPRGDLGAFLEDSPLVSGSYGYRFLRYFQADGGFDVAFGAARVKDFLQTGQGDLRIKDREYFPTFGGRAVVPLGTERALFSAGGGGLYMRYSEVVRQPSEYFRVDCPVCTSRSGWGYYALANLSLFVDGSRHFRVGVTSKFYRGNTEGEPLGPVPGTRTKDHWIGLFAELGFSF